MLRAIAFFSARPKTFSATASVGAARCPKKQNFSARSSFWASVGDALMLSRLQLQQQRKKSRQNKGSSSIHQGRSSNSGSKDQGVDMHCPIMLFRNVYKNMIQYSFSMDIYIVMDKNLFFLAWEASALAISLRQKKKEYISYLCDKQEAKKKLHRLLHLRNKG